MRITLAIFLMLALASAQAGENAAVPDFSIYPKTEDFRYAEDFRYYLSVHTNDTAWSIHQTNLLVVSTFPKGYAYAMQYFVTESGTERDRREVFQNATQNSHQRQLAEGDLKSLRSAINDLPITSTLPPIERLTIVSYSDGTNWVTRTYDSDTLPKPMREIGNIIGVRFGSSKNK